MIRDLRSIKRTEIYEIPHGEKFEIWENCFLHSYQFGLFAADSACVISDGKTTLLNANDCKTFGYPLKEIVKKFSKIDFVFRSHSSASPLPYCIKDYQQKFPNFRTKQDYIEEFSNFSLAVRARYGVPFASNHCFLHKETKKYNDTGVSPQMVADYYNSKPEAKAINSECVVMVPGSAWSTFGGFDLRKFDYNDKERIIEEMALKYEYKLNNYYEKEGKVLVDFRAFEGYFSEFLNAIPLLILKKMLPKILFKTSDVGGEKYFLLDIPLKKIINLPEDTDNVNYKGSMSFRVESHVLTSGPPARTGWLAGA